MRSPIYEPYIHKQPDQALLELLATSNDVDVMSTQDLVSSSTCLSEGECKTVFLYFFRRLAAYRNTIELYASTENALLRPRGSFDDSLECSQVLNAWGQSMHG